VPTRPSAAQPVDNGHPHTRIAVQSPAGGSLVCIQRVEARQDPHTAWEPMTALGHPPSRYEAWVVGNGPAAGEVRVWFDMPERDVDSIDIAWHMDPGIAPQAAGEEPAPPGTRQLSVPLAMVCDAFAHTNGSRHHHRQIRSTGNSTTNHICTCHRARHSWWLQSCGSSTTTKQGRGATMTHASPCLSGRGSTSYSTCCFKTVLYQRVHEGYVMPHATRQL
jgi:hypothetical protein